MKGYRNISITIGNHNMGRLNLTHLRYFVAQSWAVLQRVDTLALTVAKTPREIPIACSQGIHVVISVVADALRSHVRIIGSSPAAR